MRAPAAGLLAIAAASGSEQKVGATVATIDTAAAKPASNSTNSPGATTPGRATASAEAKPAASAESHVRASSVAKKIAADSGVDLANVSGSGPAGRVMKADVLSAASGKSAVPAAPALPIAVAAPIGSRGVRREKMTKLRQKIAIRLVEAQHSAAMLTTFNEADMTEVMRLRAEHKESFEKQFGVGLGFMGFFVKASVSALRKFPRVNAYIVGDEVEFHDFCDVAVAVGTERGLVVPVLRNAEAMGFADIEGKLKELAGKARDGKLTVDEMTGGTFTISNGGVYGSLMSTPILNPPQSAILGMHAIKKRPVEDLKNPGQITLRPMMYLALSYDHRIIDGAEAVGFLVHIKDCIEKPERMLIGM
ncbi:MAG: 2-oxoglutarate dehydrogenase complex dihydrolipoyllysine-residue succinyltransferase [Phycisphaerae bacterium]|nr:2-oxoglutarate dehydrogenase complex dihydrolipoyllysine-residue succinyltransferase [Phycisphaerae bacterium]